MGVDWSFVSVCNDVNVMCERFYSKLYKIFVLHVPTTQEMYDGALSCMV
jgi:hypothetical protein